jgi:hypothetical protein
MACSFRRRGEFMPEISSIKILEKEDGPGYFVSILEKNEGQNLACDGCKNLEFPLCLQYCLKREDLEKILKEFLTAISFGVTE